MGFVIKFLYFFTSLGVRIARGEREGDKGGFNLYVTAPYKGKVRLHLSVDLSCQIRRLCVTAELFSENLP